MVPATEPESVVTLPNESTSMMAPELTSNSVHFTVSLKATPAGFDSVSTPMVSGSSAPGA